MRLLKFFCFAALLISSVTLAKAPSENEERIVDIGFIYKIENGRVFFVRDPKVLDPGVEIDDERTMKRDQLCVLTERTIPLACPPQEISFRLHRKSGAVMMTDLRLEAETAWHRLNRAQKRFAK